MKLQDIIFGTPASQEDLARAAMSGRKNKPGC